MSGSSEIVPDYQSIKAVGFQEGLILLNIFIEKAYVSNCYVCVKFIGRVITLCLKLRAWLGLLFPHKSCKISQIFASGSI